MCFCINKNVFGKNMLNKDTIIFVFLISYTVAYPAMIPIRKHHKRESNSKEKFHHPNGLHPKIRSLLDRDREYHRRNLKLARDDIGESHHIASRNTEVSTQLNKSHLKKAKFRGLGDESVTRIFNMSGVRKGLRPFKIIIKQIKEVEKVYAEGGTEVSEIEEIIDQEVFTTSVSSPEVFTNLPSPLAKNPNPKQFNKPLTQSAAPKSLVTPPSYGYVTNKNLYGIPRYEFPQGKFRTTESAAVKFFSTTVDSEDYEDFSEFGTIKNTVEKTFENSGYSFETTNTLEKPTDASNPGISNKVQKDKAPTHYGSLPTSKETPGFRTTKIVDKSNSSSSLPKQEFLPIYRISKFKTLKELSEEASEPSFLNSVQEDSNTSNMGSFSSNITNQNSKEIHKSTNLFVPPTNKYLNDGASRNLNFNGNSNNALKQNSEESNKTNNYLPPKTTNKDMYNGTIRKSNNSISSQVQHQNLKTSINNLASKTNKPEWNNAIKTNPISNNAIKPHQTGNLESGNILPLKSDDYTHAKIKNSSSNNSSEIPKQNFKDTHKSNKLLASTLPTLTTSTINSSEVDKKEHEEVETIRQETKSIIKDIKEIIIEDEVSDTEITNVTSSIADSDVSGILKKFSSDVRKRQSNTTETTTEVTDNLSTENIDAILDQYVGFHPKRSTDEVYDENDREATEEDDIAYDTTENDQNENEITLDYD